MKQFGVFFSAILMTIVILLGFQNCGQPGQLTQISSDNPVTLSSSLEIVDPVTGEAVAPSTDSSSTDDISIDDTVHEAICRDITASDVMLNVDQVVSDGGGLKLAGPDHSISISGATVALEATASGEIREIRIILNSAGNLLLSTTEAVYDLKTPSGQTSGFKVRLATSTHVEAGQKYNLQLNIDLSQQIIRAGKKCILKPTVQNAVLSAI